MKYEGHGGEDDEAVPNALARLRAFLWFGAPKTLALIAEIDAVCRASGARTTLVWTAFTERTGMNPIAFRSWRVLVIAAEKAVAGEGALSGSLAHGASTSALPGLQNGLPAGSVLLTPAKAAAGAQRAVADSACRGDAPILLLALPGALAGRVEACGDGMRLTEDLPSHQLHPIATLTGLLALRAALPPSP